MTQPHDPLKADRPPTPSEEAAADRAAKEVDVEAVGQHFMESAQQGAEIRGEGEIEPRTKH